MKRSTLLIALLAATLSTGAFAAKKAKCDSCGVVSAIVEQEVEKNAAAGVAGEVAADKGEKTDNLFGKILASKVQDAMKVKVWDVVVTMDGKKGERSLRLSEKPAFNQGDRVKVEGEKLALVK